MERRPIGVFDSGMGGLSVVESIRRFMPLEDILYIGDSAHAPYGVKEKSEVLERSIAIGDELVGRSCKAIVVACNTATSVAIGALRDRYNIPVIGMEPALKLATEEVEGTILVLATELTLSEQKFAGLMERVGRSHTVLKLPAPELVTLVEAGHLDDEEAVKTVSTLLEPYTHQSVSGIVLGCTHFVFLRATIERLLPDTRVIDGNEGTVRQLMRMLDADVVDPLASKAGTLVIENTAGASMVDRSKTLLRKSQLSSKR